MHDNQCEIEQVVIGVDLGTTGTKTGIFDSTGRLISEAYEESILFSPLTCYPILDMEPFGMPDAYLPTVD